MLDKIIGDVADSYIRLLKNLKEMKNMEIKDVIESLKIKNKTVSTMESCTGGGIANAITNVEGASDVFKFGAVTYSNDFKIKMGVDKNIIDKYSVYSMETAHEMSKNISLFTNSNYGIGITGKLNRVDKNNHYGRDNIVFISIYDSDNDKFYDKEIEVTLGSRKENKELIITNVIDLLILSEVK